ncbi:MAG: C1 family peptidase [Planctomycetota bacterium]
MSHRLSHTLLAVCLFVLVGGFSSSLAFAQEEAAPKKTGRTTEDGLFTIDKDLDNLAVLSQGNTGTCWAFATVSFFEAEILRSSGKRVDLSEIYPVYFTYLLKARRYLEKKGESQFTEGGLSHDLRLVIEEFGVAPQSAFKGLLPGDRIHNHSELSRVTKGFLDGLLPKKPKEGQRKRRRKFVPSKKWEDAYRGILDAYLGEIPKTVTVDGKEMSTQEYARDHCGFKSEDYLEVMSNGTKPMWEENSLDVPDNWCRDAKYRNVPLKDLMEAMDHAVAKGYSVAVDVDVSEPGFKARKGVATLPAELEKKGAVTQEIRDQMFKSGKTSDDHLMHVVGTAKDKNGKVFYVVKNSWGKIGPYQGYMFMSRPYMAAKMLAFMVHKGGLPKPVIEKVQP